MSLKLMYITNRIDVALVAQDAGVDRIWVDLEYIGKEERQPGMDTVKSHHTIDDIVKLRPYVKTSELVVRINPIHEKNEVYLGTIDEIEKVIAAGADRIMLPMFRTTHEAELFLKVVNGRVGTILLFETIDSIKNIDEILNLPNIDEVYVGLNDLHLEMNKKFMFELVADGTMDYIASKFKNKGLTFGFGGIARIGYGDLPAEFILPEHYRLGSKIVILSRSFCNANKSIDANDIKDAFIYGVKGLRDKEKEIINNYTLNDFYKNHLNVKNLVDIIKKGRDDER